MKARDKSDAVIRAKGKPLNAFGTSLPAVLSRRPAKITIASVKPTADEKPNTTASMKL